MSKKELARRLRMIANGLRDHADQNLLRLAATIISQEAEDRRALIMASGGIGVAVGALLAFMVL